MFTRLTNKQIDNKIKFIEDYINSSNPADGSKFDANSNVTSKNIATLENELNKDINIQVNRKLVSNEIEKLFGKDIAEEYIRQLESHEIYTHDETSIKPYCVSVNMYPLLSKGLKSLGFESEVPKHLKSFCGNFINLVYFVASQFAGAVATVEFLLYFDYFARKEYGDDYMNKLTPKIRKELNQFFQEVIYQINFPSAARGNQAVFWNISLYDEYYFSSLFGDFIFPDGTKPSWNSLEKLQRFFMKWFNKEREKAVLTFPVITAAMLTKDKKPKDIVFEDFIAEELSEGNSFFIYQSNSADSLSSCCFDGNQKCLTKSSTGGVKYMSFKELSESKYNDTKKNFSIFHNGRWVKGKEIKLPERKMYKIKTSNNKEIIVSDNHLNATINGDIRTDKLKVGDKLLFNTAKLGAVKENDLGLSYSQGIIIGAFLGDGSFGKRHIDGIHETMFSLSVNKIDFIEKHLIKTLKELGIEGNIRKGKVYNNVYPMSIVSKKLVAFIQKWTNWKEGTYSYNKKLNLNCLLQDDKFRKGILDGWYITDGGNNNRCYTSSPELAEHMEVLITSLGMNSIINISDRTDEKVIIRREEFNRNYPLYCIRWYSPNNKSSMKDVYTIKNNSIYFNIISIEEIGKTGDIYCFEMKNKDEPYFTLPNGIITHNCRLRSEISDNTFSYSLGAGGVSTGSINVITINFNRLIQDGRNLKTEIDKIHKYQLAYLSLIKKYKNAGLLPVYDAGFISLDKQFLTIGINGMVEAAEYKGFIVSNNYDYKKWVSSQLKVIYDSNKAIKKETGIMFNTEFVPAENLGVKNAKWDKKDGYKVSRDCYNSYFYVVEDSNTTPLDKFDLHGEEIIKYLDGGSALHLNLEEYLTKENYKNLLRVSANTGCNYFTTNVKVTICNKCDYINKNTETSCIKCGSKDVDYGTRVIGYLKRISNFSSDRQKEEGIRYYSEK